MNATGPMRRLLLEQACRDLVLRAAACIDAQDYDGFAAMFEPAGQLVRPGAARLDGPEAIAAAYRARPADRITRHLVMNTRVDIESATQARARSLVLLWSGLARDPTTDFGRPATGRQVVGEFDDHLLLTVTGWRFTHREARFVLFKD